MNTVYNIGRMTKASPPQVAQRPVAQGDKERDASNGIVAKSDPTVKNKLSFSSPQSDIDAIADDIPMRHVDGTVRTHAEYRAEKAAEPSAAKTQQDFTPASGTKKPPTEDEDVARIVNAEGNKRAEDIELQYTQYPFRPGATYPFRAQA